MGFSSDNVMQQCQVIGCDCASLLYRDAVATHDAVCLRFTRRQGSGMVWQQLNDVEGVVEAEGWRRIPSFTQGAPVLLLFEPHSDASVVALHSSLRLDEILVACANAPFYITNGTYSYLLAFNGRDTLFGCGTAKDWIAELKKPSWFENQW